MKSLLLSLLVVLLFVSCENSSTSSEENNGNTTISGKFDNSSEQPIYLEELTAEAIVPVDTSKTDASGNFSFSADVKEPGFYRIKISDKNFLVLILNKEEKVTVNADAQNLEATYSVSGSSSSERLKVFNHFMNAIYKTADSLQAAARMHQTNRDVPAYSKAIEFNAILSNKLNNFITRFVDEKPGSLESLAAIEKINPEEFLPYYIKVEEAMKESFPDSKYYKSFSERVKALSFLAPGTEAPEISLSSPSGENVTLSSLKGNYVLIDFWASWCKPCRMENPNVVKVYQKYHSKGFEIFGVSLDKEKGAWEAAIQQDGLIWKHASDLGFWNSSVVKLYNISSIPFTVLVDKEGKIVAKNLRGAQLEAKLAEIFGS